MQQSKETFKTLIDKCGLSLIGAARLLNTPYPTIKSYSSGARRPSLVILRKLAKYSKAADVIFNTAGADDE